MLYLCSSSTRQTHSVSINLDNLEQLQDRWAKRYESSKCPPPAPELNSPRSLAACKRCGVDPQKHLQKLSLMQHLLRLSNKLQYVEETVALLSQRLDLKTALQAAVLAFQNTSIGLGTSKEKLVAYMGFLNQEEVRAPRLEEVRRARRQIIEEGTAAHEGSRDGAAAAAGENLSHALLRVKNPDYSDDLDMVVSAVNVRNIQSDMLPHASRGLVVTSPIKATNSTLTTPLSHSDNTYTGVGQQFRSSRTPYTPRDAMALSTNHFGIPTLKPMEAVGNPSSSPSLCLVDEQPSLVDSRLRIGVVPSEKGIEGRAGDNKMLPIDVLRSQSGNRFTGEKTRVASVSRSALRDEGSNGVAVPYTSSNFQRSSDENRGIGKDSNAVLNAMNTRSGVKTTTVKQEKTSFLATFSRDNRKTSEMQGQGSVKEALNASLSSLPLDDYVKQSITYTPMIYGREPCEPFVYYCANPAPLFA